MRSLVLVLTACIAFAGGVVVAQANQSPVTMCHSQAQTQCLWVDGHAEWH